MIKICMFTLIILILQVNILFAHRPSGMDLGYDSNKEALDINIFHNTPNGQLHYIKKVVVYKNNDELKWLSFVEQPDAPGLEAKVSIKAVSGDTFRVKAYCKNGGIIENVFVVSN